MNNEIKCNVTCSVVKKISKEKKVYYILKVNELGKESYLTETELKLLKALNLLQSEEEN